jgi:hypothetical protein
MAQIKSSALYAITSKTIDSRPNEVIALIRRNGVMIPDGASKDTIDNAFVSLITKSRAFQQQFAQLATKTVVEGGATISFDGSVANDGAFNKSSLMFDGSVANDGAFNKSSLMFDGSVGNDGAFNKSSLSFDGTLARDGAMEMSNFKDVSNEVNFEGAFPKSSFDDISDEVNFSGAGLSSSSSKPPTSPFSKPPTSSAPKPPTTSVITAPSKSGSSSGGSKKSGSGFGSTFTPEFIQGLLATGLSIWAYNKTGKTSDELKGNLDEGRNDPNYNTGNNNNDSNTKGGLSTTGIVLISLGVITAIGVAVYFVRKK